MKAQLQCSPEFRSNGEEKTGCVLARRAAMSTGMTHTRMMLMSKNRTGNDYLISWRASRLFNKMAEQAAVGEDISGPLEL